MRTDFRLKLRKIMKKSHYLWKKKNNKLSWSDCLKRAWKLIKLNLSRKSQAVVEQVKNFNNIYLFKNTHKDIENMWVRKFINMLIGSPDKIEHLMNRRKEYSLYIKKNHSNMHYLIFNT